MNNKQVKQIYHFLTAYPDDVVEAGIEAWRKKNLPDIMEGMAGMVTDIPLAQKYVELTEEAQQVLREEAEKRREVMPFCPKCGTQLALSGVCQGCSKGKEGFQSKLLCVSKGCGFEEYFKTSPNEKYQEILKSGGKHGNSTAGL